MSAEYLSSQQRKTLYEINSKLMEEQDVTSQTVERVGSTIAAVPKLAEVKTKDWGRSVADLDLFLHHLTNRGSELVEWEVGSVLEPLLRQRDLAVRREIAHERHRASHSRKGRNRWAYIPTVTAIAALLVTVPLSISAFGQSQEVESELLKDPSYRQSITYKEIAGHLGDAAYHLNLNGSEFGVPQAERQITQASRKASAPPLDLVLYSTQLDSIREAIDDGWTKENNDPIQLVRQRTALLRQQGDFQARSAETEAQAPKDLLLQRDNALMRFNGWMLASGVLIILGLSHLRPKRD